MRSWLLALVLCVACGKNNEPPPPSSGVPGAKPESGPKHNTGALVGTGDDRAKALFGQLCVTCHGADGKGDGPVAKSLPVKPRNYTDAVWQANTTDDQIKEIILKGGKAVGKSEMMPGNPDLVDDPAKLAGLVKIVRAFAPSGGGPAK